MSKITVFLKSYKTKILAGILVLVLVAPFFVYAKSFSFTRQTLNPEPEFHPGSFEQVNLSSGSERVPEVSINGGVGVSVAKDRAFRIKIKVKVKLTQDDIDNGDVEIRLVDADSIFGLLDDILKIYVHELTGEESVGEEIIINFNAWLFNIEGIIMGEDGTSGEKTAELALEVGESSNNHKDTREGKEVKMGVIKNWGLEIIKTLIGTLDDSQIASTIFMIIDGVKSSSGLLNNSAKIDLLNAFLQFLEMPDEATLRNYILEWCDAAGLGFVAKGLLLQFDNLLWGYLDNIQERDWTNLKNLLRNKIMELEQESSLDQDSDSFYDQLENEAGSDPLLASSTPEHAIILTSCNDGIDNDSDGSLDLAELDGPDYDNLADCLDTDGDGVVDYQDICIFVPNPAQIDSDFDGAGDLCEAFPYNSDELLDSDNDGTGDRADLDDDNDSFADEYEYIMGSDTYNSASTPEDLSVGTTCFDGIDNDLDDITEPYGGIDGQDWGCIDSDIDNVSDALDNCLSIYNPSQENTDLDAWGNACDLDDDNDGVLDTYDNCPNDYNPDQRDSDRDGMGDACDTSRRGSKYNIMVDFWGPLF